jgi:uncharacterized protein YaiE (UPF0345 family)
MIFPGLDVKTLSDDELMKRIDQLNQRISYAYSFGSAALEQLQILQEALQSEQQDRMMRRAWDESQKKQKATIESDPEFDTKRQSTQSQSEKKSTKAGVVIPTRTKAPVIGS